MRIVALNAIANRRRMHRVAGFNFVVVVAGVAEGQWRGGRELYPGDVLVDPDFMAGGTAGGDRGMNMRALRLVLVTLEAGTGIGLRIQRNRVLAGPRHSAEDHENQCQNGT